MVRKNPKQRTRKSEIAEGFRISNGPVIGSAADIERESSELPRVQGAPTLFAIARDPNTIFTYWSVDWATIFAKTMPVDRQVHLRVYRADGVEEKSAAVEPMAGNCYIAVSRPSDSYHVEIGYYQPADVWHLVAVSDEVAMPPDKVVEVADVDLVTIPFHLSFQRLLDFFRVSNGDALVEVISRFQKRALTDEARELLTPEEREILHAMNLSLLEIAAARRAFLDRADDQMLRKRTEAILGFGSTSPLRGFGGPSWGSGAA
ncbi:MAG: DUF4912 domain-containing protein [Verrucomicrobia bacterium]|nr:MAG: DUF4912 domain-containing protein [Verrucomicrobiota bacterium]